MSFLLVHDFKIGYQEIVQTNKKTPIVFLHGVGSDKSSWQSQLRFFGTTRRAVAFDYPGYAESGLAEKDLTRREIADFLLGALDVLKIEKAHFCGLSMGGIVALEIYQQQPEKVASLVLANTFARHPNGAQIVERSLEFIAENSLREFAEQRVNLLLAPETPPEIGSEVVKTMARINEATYRWASRAVWTADYRDLLPKIAVPTLVIGGEFDQPTPPALSEELARNIPNAKCEIIQNAGHLSNLDQPEVFNRLLTEFLDAEN